LTADERWPRWRIERSRPPHGGRRFTGTTPSAPDLARILGAAARPGHREHRQETIMINPRPGPRSGDDTYDLIDDALFKLAERRGAWLGDDLTAITLIASLIDQAERFLPDLVTTARLNSHTWEQIAQALATSPQEARLRFDPESPIADTRWPHDL
jgi:hypothetical protein